MLGIGAILLSIFIPYAGKLQEQSNRDRCADNLRQLNRALQEYAKLNQNDLPRAVYDLAANPNGYTAFTGPYAGSPLSPGVGPNDVTASLWLLVATPDPNSKTKAAILTDLSLFVCPSTLDKADPRPTPMSRPNFRSGENLSYSYASPFSGYEDYKLNSDIMPAQFAIMADKNPGAVAASIAANAPPLDLSKANSRNHGRAGQNVLYADGSVTFQTTPYCGVGQTSDRPGDNIYSALSPVPLSGQTIDYTGRGYIGRTYGPSYQYDSYLVPTADDGQ